MPPISNYILMEVEEIVKETDTAFLLRFYNGDEEWVKKEDIASFGTYELGDRNVTIHLKEY